MHFIIVVERFSVQRGVPVAPAGDVEKRLRPKRVKMNLALAIRFKKKIETKL